MCAVSATHFYFFYNSRHKPSRRLSLSSQHSFKLCKAELCTHTHAQKLKNPKILNMENILFTFGFPEGGKRGQKLPFNNSLVEKTNKRPWFVFLARFNYTTQTLDHAHLILGTGRLTTDIAEAQLFFSLLSLVLGRRRVKFDSVQNKPKFCICLNLFPSYTRSIIMILEWKLP